MAAAVCGIYLFAAPMQCLLINPLATFFNVLVDLVSAVQDQRDEGSLLQVGGGNGTAGGAVGQAGPSLLSEESLFLHSLSAPTLSGVGACNGAGTFKSSSGGSGGDGVSSIGSRSALSKAGGGMAPRQRAESTPRETRVALPPLAS